MNHIVKATEALWEKGDWLLLVRNMVLISKHHGGRALSLQDQ
jgi:hypothetical protein